MPGAAAERRVVDAAVRGRSCASRGSCSRTSSSPRVARPAEQRRAERPVEVLGEDREDVDAHGAHRSNRPSGGSIDDDARLVLDDEHHRDERAAVEHEQVVRGVRLDRRRPRPSTVPGAVAHLGADQLVHPQLAVGRVVERLGRAAICAAQRLGRVAVVDARRSARASGRWCGRDVSTTSVALARRTAPSPGASALGDGC